jgi:hypothetical protein
MGVSQVKLDQSMAREGVDSFWTVQWNWPLLEDQSETPDSQAAPLHVHEEIPALCEALITSEARLDA